MTTIYIVRHGAYENADHVFPGWGPGFPLSDEGREQVGHLAAYFSDKHVDVLYSSPIRRTRETAKILSETVKLPINFDIRLVEVRTNMEGMPMKLFDETNGELSYRPEWLAKGAESMEALGKRVHDCLEDLRKSNVGKTLLVVSHGDPIRFGIMTYLGWPMDFVKSREIATPLAGGYRLDIDEEGEAQVNPIVLDNYAAS